MRATEFVVDCLLPLAASGCVWWYGSRVLPSHPDPSKRRLGRRLSLLGGIAFACSVVVLGTFLYGYFGACHP